MSFGVIPADSIASFDAFNAISITLSLNLPYLVLPAPRIQALFVMSLENTFCTYIKIVRHQYIQYNIHIYLVYCIMHDAKNKPLTLVICEKPHAALRIAQALGTNSFKRSISSQGVSFFYAVSNNNSHFVIFSSIGHLYGLVDITKNRVTYPVFDLVWMPIISKSGRLTRAKQIIKSISDVSKKATRFIHACDYDQEGEVIGYNILQYSCKFKYDKSLRAKFSTLTDQEIRESFDNLLKPSTGLAEAGRCRHILDFIYGVNLSRALSQLFKVGNNGKQYHNLSIGRVQGPTLAFIVQKEIDIRKHIP